MTHLVVDASVAIKWLLPEIHAEAARRVLSEDFTLLAPDLIWAEVGNALWKQWRRGQMAGEVMQGLLQDFQRAPLEISSSGSLVTVACDLARRFERSFYDSLYLALARHRACPVVTADRKLFNSLKGDPHAPSLMWVEDIP